MGSDAGAEGSARRLVLLRHAKSSWDDADRPDADRPLSPRGVRDARAVGHWLASNVGRPDLVLCSTAVRTRQTWAGVLQAEPDRLAGVPVRFEQAIYQAWPDTLLELAQGLPDDVTTAVLVGHSPGVPDLAERLNRASGDRPVGDFPTSAVAVFAVAGAWGALGPGSASLQAYAVPRG